MIRREIRQKANVTFHPENNTVSYFYRRWWYFEPELTNGSLSDPITQLNAVAIVSIRISGSLLLQIP